MSVKKLKTLARLVRAIRPEMEKLEGRQLMSGTPPVVQTLPYVLDFSAPQPGVTDKNNLGTGFTVVQPNRLGTQYQPSLIYLNTATKDLELTTQGTSTTGSNYGTDNTMVNGLETQFDGTTNGFSIITRLKGPLSQMNANYDGAGVYFGPDQDNYVKLVAEYASGSGGQVLQFTDEQNATVHTVNTIINVGSFANLTTLDLKLTGNAGNGTVTAAYAVNGGAFLNIAGTVALTGAEASAFFNSAATAGITALSRNNLAPITVPFGHFEIDAGAAVSNNHPSIRFTSPANNATGVLVSAPIEADLNLPNSAIMASTITPSTVYLVRSSDQSPVPAVVNTSGGGDSIILTPNSALAANTQYTFVVTAGVTDTTGASMVPYSETFTTGAAPTQVSPSIKFTQTNLPNATGASFTNVKIGPDGLLYASTEDGLIYRWVINTDGTLQTPQIINSLQQFNGGNRLITGFAFDPSASPSSPVLWVSNSYYALSGATTGVDFTGAITVLSGPNLATVQNAITSLPRSVADHSTEQPTFGPGPIAGHNYLYFAQASNSAFGAPDSTWGNRPEHLLNAAILRLDTTALNLSAGPVDVKTPDAGGTYNPFSATAPLIIYATGVRNAFSLLWTSNGQLLAPNNGSSAGGNTPAYNSSDPQQIDGSRITSTSGAGPAYSGPNVPGLTNVQMTEDDYLYNVVQGGYYGHPNPTRGEYVLNDGNPSTGAVADEVVSAYPAGTNPDSNYRGAAWDFGPHVSADGIIEYQDKTFGGAMQNAILVTEYSAGSDIVWLQRDSNGNVISEVKGISGFGNLDNPVSLTENTANGNIYVSELGGQRLVLLKPVVPAPVAVASRGLVVISDIAKGYTGAATSGPQAITITNTGTTALNFAASGAFTIVNDPSAPTADAAAFSISNAASLPTTLAPGASMTVNVTYTAGKVGAQYARLQIAGNDPNGPLFVTLHGIGTTGTGGANEPSLPAILRAYNIPTITGDGVNDANMNQTFYPASPDASSQEVAMQRLVKAGDGPVSIQLLASFNAAGVAGSALAQVGYYTAGSGSPLDKTQVFTLAQADAQTTNPTALGGTAFDPGTGTFGLYTIFPHFTDNGQPRISYSEDALNPWDANVPRKVRFFPLKNADGSTVPNAYVFAFEDNNIPFGAIQPYDSNDIVGIIRNVKPAANVINAAAIGIENEDGAPASNRVVFSRIQVPNASYTDVVHDKSSILIRNTGTQPLTISSLVLSDSKNWTITSAPTQPIAPGATGTVTIQFIAQAAPVHSDNLTNDSVPAGDPGWTVTTASGIWTGTLTINSNDPANPARAVTLAGYWQHTSEHEEEPGLQAMINTLFGYKTNIASTALNDYVEGASTPTYYGEEVVSPFWNLADTTQSVTVTQLAAYHQQYDPVGKLLTQAQFGWYTKGSTHTNYILKNAVQNGQTLFPLNTSGGLSTLSFSPATTSAPTFGFSLDGNFSDDSRNTVGGGGGHHVRFYPLRDSAGNVVPNSYLAVLDYGSASYENYDFQDNVYILTNIKPAGKTSQPTNVRASAQPAGGINVQWAPIAASATLTGYNVYRATSATGTYTRLTSSPITGTSYLDSQAPAGTLSYYKITAVDSSTGESLGSTASTSAIPAAPTGNTATAINAGSIKVTWNAVAGATLYHIERQIVGGTGFVEVATSTGASFTDTGLSGATHYVYQVRAENGSGYSPYGNVSSATTPSGVAPGVPTNLHASLNNQNQIVLTWTAPAGPVTGYHVEREAQGATSFTEIAASVTATSFTDTSALAGTSYSYRIRAENTGTLGAYTGTVTLATGAGVSAPTGLGATVISSTEVDLKWTAAAGTVTLYHIERQDPTTQAWSEIGTSAAVTYQDKAASAGMNYNYRVRSENSGSFSGYAGPVNAVTPVAAPAAPAAVSATANSSSQVTLSWSSVSSATSYILKRQVTGSGTTWTVLSSGWTTGTTYTDNGVQASTQYTYEVAAQNSAGPSAFVQSTPVTTPAATVASTYASADINATPAGGTTVNADASSYDVTGYGSDIGYTSTDSFRFVYQQLTGNFDAVVQVQSLTNSFSTAKAGLMARSTLDAGSAMVFDGATAASSYRWLYRSAINGNPTFASVGSNVSYPNVWVRLKRVGNVFTGYSSTDGMNWTQTGTVTLNLGPTIYFGMASSSHNTSTPTTAQFRSLSVLTPPAAPTLATPAANSSSAITLNWNSIPTATSYTVLRSTTPGGTYASIATAVISTTYMDTGLSASTPYYYEVVAVNSVGSSAASNSGTATTQGTSLSAPSSPTISSGTSPNSSEIDLSWSAPSGATSYALQRSTDGMTWTPVVSNWASTSYSDKGLSAGTSYQYEVTASNSVGSSQPSAPYSASTLPAAPAAPVIQNATSPAPTEIDLTWSAPGGATAYDVRRSTDGTTWTAVVSNWASTSYQDKSVAAGTSYQYQVFAKNAGGSSPASASYSISSEIAAPAAPVILSGSSPSPTEIDLTWSTPANATSYTVQRSADSGSTWTSLTPTVTQASFKDTGVAAATTYQYRVVATNSTGSSPASAAFTVKSQTLFASMDIGTSTAGSTTAVTNDSAYDVTAGGTGIYNTSDSFRFVYTQFTGDFDIAVQVSSLSGGASGVYPQAGLMARATLDAASPDVAITASPVGGYRFKYRDKISDPTTQTQTSSGVNAAFPNSWVRLKRVGNVFTTYYGSDGKTWTQLGTVTLTTLSATQPIYIGMAVASNSASTTTTADFLNFTGA